MCSEFVLLLRCAEWVIYAKRPFGGPQAVRRLSVAATPTASLSQTAASSHSTVIASPSAGSDYRARGERAGRMDHTMTLPVDEFMRRFLLHRSP